MQFTLTFTGSMSDVASLMAVLKAMDKPNAETAGVTRQVIVAPTAPDAEAVEAQLSFDDVTPPAADAPAAPAKRGRKPGNSSAKFKEAAMAVEANAVDDEPATPAQSIAPAPSAEALDADAVRDLMSDAIAKVGAADVLSALSKYKTRRLGELDKKHYPAFANVLNGLIDGAATAAVV